jgi:hypothetical protein
MGISFKTFYFRVIFSSISCTKLREPKNVELLAIELNTLKKESSVRILALPHKAHIHTHDVGLVAISLSDAISIEDFPSFQNRLCQQHWHTFTFFLACGNTILLRDIWWPKV